MSFTYERQPFVDVDHTFGPSVTGYAHKIILNGHNFDFSQCRPDLFDIQFADASGAVLPHYRYFYGTEPGGTGIQAIFFVKIDLLAGEVKPITLRWGDPTVGIDPSDDDVCIYANRLSSTSDLADLATSFGSLSTAIIADSNAPEGNALEFTGGTSHSGLMKAVDLPETYEAWLMEAANVGQSSGHYPSPLLEASDATNWHRIGRINNDARLNIRQNGNNTWHHTHGAAPNENPDAGVYLIQQTLVGPNRRFVEVDSWDLLGAGGVERGAQGVAYHPDVGWITTGNNELSRWDISTRAEVDYLAPTVQGTSFGDCHIVDLGDGNGLQCYIGRFDTTTPQTTVYRIDPNDFSGGLTLVADITASFPATHSSGCMVYDPNRERWLVGSARVSNVRMDFYEFSKDFSIFYGKLDAHEADPAGFNGCDFSNGLLFATEHASSSSAAQDRTFWQTYALDESARVLHGSHSLYPQMNDGQGVSYDQERDLWYAMNRPASPNKISVLRLDVDDSRRQITGRWPHNSWSIGSACLHDITTPQQSQVGVGAYRACRVANLAYVKSVYPLPVNRLPVRSNSTVSPTPAGLLSLAGVPRVVTVS